MYIKSQRQKRQKKKNSGVLKNLLNSTIDKNDIY